MDWAKGIVGMVANEGQIVNLPGGAMHGNAARGRPHGPMDRSLELEMIKWQHQIEVLSSTDSQHFFPEIYIIYIYCILYIIQIKQKRRFYRYSPKIGSWENGSTVCQLWVHSLKLSPTSHVHRLSVL